MHEIKIEIKGEYKEGNCGVLIDSGEKEQPYLILNLEVYHGMKGMGGAHCDFVYIIKDKENNQFNVFAVELKGFENVNGKKEIRESLQGKFPNTLQFLKDDLIQVLGLDTTRRVQYFAVIAIPSDILLTIKSLIERDKNLMGELKNFNKAWITGCGSEKGIKYRLIHIK